MDHSLGTKIKCQLFADPRWFILFDMHHVMHRTLDLPRDIYTRIEQHLGRSYRTGMLLTKLGSSAIKSHAENCDSNFSIENFKTIGCENNLVDLRLLESLHILKKKPNLNDHTFAVQLNVVV